MIRMHDFLDGRGLVPVRRHKNPDGTSGPLVPCSASIGENVMIGESAFIGHEAFVGDNVHIGSSVRIVNNASIGPGVRIGAYSCIGARAIIRAHVVIGACSRIGAESRIGAGARIGAWAQIGEGADGEDRRTLAGGALCSYQWDSWLTADGARWLRFGCETHRCSEWPALIDGLCAKHEPERVETYRAVLSALLGVCAAMPGLRTETARPS